MYLKGIYRKTIYSRDNYYVGLLKIKDNDISEDLNNKTVTFTGYFTNLNIDDNLLINGSFTKHSKYGEQFSVTSYEIIIPDEKDGIVTFLSSDIFKGIGETKARKIYDSFGEKSIDTIINKPSELEKVKGLTKKNIENLHNKLLEYTDSIDVIIKLNDYGFTNRDSSSLYNHYKAKVLDIIDNNIYDLIDDEFSFKKIDPIALRHNYSKLDTASNLEPFYEKIGYHTNENYLHMIKRI